MSCPHCSGKDGYLIRVRALGYTLHRGDWETQDEKIVSDSELRFVSDKSVTCVECGRRTYFKTIRNKGV